MSVVTIPTKVVDAGSHLIARQGSRPVDVGVGVNGSNSDQPFVLECTPSDWRYLSEGKLNLVFACAHQLTQSTDHLSQPKEVNGNHSALIGRVIKINKSILKDANEVYATSSVLARRLEFGFRYVDRVMRPLFDEGRKSSNSDSDQSSRNWLDSGQIVFIKAETIHQIIHRDRARRPVARVQQFANFLCPSAELLIPVFLFEDYTSPLHLHLKRGTLHAIANVPPPPTICFEVKPKWGFLPRRQPEVEPLLHPMKYNTCRYCMHQYLKVERGEVPTLSLFCPLDLYSCTPMRVDRALKHLMLAPQNNLRMFIRRGEDGGSSPIDAATLADGGEVELVNFSKLEQIDALAHTLFPNLELTSSSSNRLESHIELLRSFLTQLICTAPPFRTIFSYLSQLQSKLDALDIERLYPLIQCLPEGVLEKWHVDQLWRGVEEQANSPLPAWLDSILQRIRLEQTDSNRNSSFTSASVRSSSSIPSPGIFQFPSNFPLDSNCVDLSTIPLCAHCSRVNSTSEKGNFSHSYASDDPSHTHPFSLPTPCSSSANCPYWSQDRCVCWILNSLREFLLATTLKDVSIMCTMQVMEENEPVNIDAHGGVHSSTCSTASTQVHYAVRLIDLEAKSVSKLPEYYRLDREIVENYTKTMKMNGSKADQG